MGVVGGNRLYREAIIASLEAEPDLASLSERDCVPTGPGDVAVLLIDGNDQPALPPGPRVLPVRISGPAGVGEVSGDHRLDDIIRALRELLDSQERILALAPPSPQSGRRRALTARELEVLRLIGTGHTAEEIAAVLQTTTHGVENAKRRIFEKLGVQTQTHAVAKALRDGTLVAPITGRVNRPRT